MARLAHPQKLGGPWGARVARPTRERWPLRRWTMEANMVADARPRRKSRGMATPQEVEEGCRRTRVPRASLEFGSPGGHGAMR
eukprot:scaffold273885_cov21-Tisochrysis_lutea.AAC.1